MENAVEACRNILIRCMGLREGESTLVVTDTEREEIGRVILEAALSLGSDASIIVMRPRAVNGEEPPAAVEAAMAAAKVVMCPTTKSLTHTQARKAAAAAGARVATMPGITMDMLYEGAMTADYEQVSALTMRVAELVNKASSAKISYKGHVLTMGLAGRNAIPSTGRFLNPGESGNLPSGEAYVAPVEGTAEGELYVDGSFAGFGKLNGPLVVRVREGRAVSFEGVDAGAIEAMLKTDESRNVAELGIGTNERARLTGVILEDEKIYGTVHVAFGDNSTFGGTVRAGIHIDGIMLAPDLYLDDVLVVHDGKVLV